MGISQYIREIGRGKHGARSLSREQAADLFGQVLDGTVSELETGGFCLAMRIKGETPEEMAGFVDATHLRMNRLPATLRPVIVIPSYNGARKLPVLTPLLALLLAREGLPVLVHGTPTESNRIEVSTVLAALDIPARHAIGSMEAGEVAFVATELLCPGLKRLLDVRRVVGVRNPAHSVVKLITPCLGSSLIVSSYTHPEYAVSMAATIELMQSSALLLRGTEGESVADARRMPRMEGFVAGQRVLEQKAESGSIARLAELPREIDAVSTARYIRRVMAGESLLPASIAQQVKHIVQLTSRLQGYN